MSSDRSFSAGKRLAQPPAGEEVVIAGMIQYTQNKIIFFIK